MRGYYKGTSLRESELFINKQMFIEHLLCARHRGYSGEQDRRGPCSYGADVLVSDDRQLIKILVSGNDEGHEEKQNCVSG